MYTVEISSYCYSTNNINSTFSFFPLYLPIQTQPCFVKIMESLNLVKCMEYKTMAVKLLLYSLVISPRLFLINEGGIIANKI